MPDESAQGKSPFGKRRTPRPPTHFVAPPPELQIPGGRREDSAESSSQPRIEPTIWLYQWEDPLGVQEPVTFPTPVNRIRDEIVRKLETGIKALVLVRGELGIGKTLLSGLLRDALISEAARLAEAGSLQAASLRMTQVVEAQDVETPREFARRLNAYIGTRPVVALARPPTIDIASSLILASPSASLELLPFEPGSVLFDECIAKIGQRHGLTDESKQRLIQFATQLPRSLRTPFYFERLADFVATTASNGSPVHRVGVTLLAALAYSLEQKVGTASFNALCDQAFSAPLGRGMQIPPQQRVQGILSDHGFLHDGYRIFLLAASVDNGRLPLQSLLAAPNSVDALQMLLDHLVRLGPSVNAERPHHLLDQLIAFAGTDEVGSTIARGLYKRAIVAKALRDVDVVEAAIATQQLCLRLINEQQRAAQASDLPGPLGDGLYHTLWRDISDTLSLLGDPRLIQAAKDRFQPDSGYFVFVPRVDVTIGSATQPPRADMAKPVLSYAVQKVSVGPLWVGRYLVTTELFEEFWDDPLRDQYFTGQGRLWATGDAGLIALINRDFDLTSPRLYWKELLEARSDSPSASPSVLQLARERALRVTRIALWDQAQADQRYSGRGNPVVGVNWWEAIAFCSWWQVNVLPNAGFPPGSSVSLLTDWEWEAVRRLYYDGVAGSAGEQFRQRQMPAHVRGAAGLDEVRRPLHVGLFPVPGRGGPTDMAGNVWEWTRSATLGTIIKTSTNDPIFGLTGWDHGDARRERRACSDERDLIDQPGDLRYRTTRGGSYFARDIETAWNAAYRLCDPPYASFTDLGFRIAVYPLEQRTVAAS